jgi:hypothetical protein
MTRRCQLSCSRWRLPDRWVVTIVAPSEGAGIVVRIYDSEHHDYHRWDTREEHAYREYLASDHPAYIAGGGLSSLKQRSSRVGRIVLGMASNKSPPARAIYQSLQCAFLGRGM